MEVKECRALIQRLKAKLMKAQLELSHAQEIAMYKEVSASLDAPVNLKKAS